MRSWTVSTRSSRPGPPSTRSTPAGATRRSRLPPCAGDEPLGRASAERPQLPATLLVGAAQPAPRIAATEIDQSLDELLGEHQVTQELAAVRPAAGVQQAAERREVGRAQQRKRRAVMATVDLCRHAADLVRYFGCDLPVGEA